MQVDKGRRKLHDPGVGLGAALVATRRAAKLSQEALAKAAFGDPKRQSRISKWEKGHEVPSLEEINRIETATGKPRGWVLIRAGYVEVPTTVAAAIAADAQLSDDYREMVLDAHRVATALSVPKRRPTGRR